VVAKMNPMAWIPNIIILCFVMAQASSQQPTAEQARAVPPSRQASQVAVIDVTGPIDRVTEQSIRRRALLAIDEGADVLVLELDTPGGDLEATLDICRFIKQESKSRTGAWVHAEAYSAGAIIALATDGVVMASGARMGDAAPIQGSPITGILQLPATERAKIESPVLAEVVDSARRNGYDEKLVQSMVSVRFALWELEEIDGPGRIFVDANEYRRIYGESPPLDRGRGSMPTTPSDAPPLEAETIETIDILQNINPDRPKLGPDDASSWKLRGQVIGDEELLVVNTEEARRMGLSGAVVDNDRELARWYGATRIVRYQESWAESLVRFLTSWPIQAILVGIVVIGFFLEIAAPGTSLFGGAALLALAVLIGAPMLSGMTDWWDILLIFSGLLLIGIEIVLLPGVGVAGVLGAISLIVGLAGVMVTADMGTNEANNQISAAIVAILGACLLGGVGAWWLTRQTGGFWLFNRMILDAQSGQDGTVNATAPEQSASVGRTALAATDLRPSGRIEIDGALRAARSTVGWIDSGSPVRILGEFAGELEVEPLNDRTDDEFTERTETP
jgi:membrane-bound ClpP family serine protease